MNTKKIILGIDLGTSNSALTWKYDGDDEINIFSIEQLSNYNELVKQNTLASVIYCPIEAEIQSIPNNQLLWDNPKIVVGEWARNNTSTNPNRTIQSAKSWLCSKHIDCSNAILPWESEMKEKLSPIQASSLILQHLRYQFEFFMNRNHTPLDWHNVDVVITVPASFDEFARKHTLTAAKDAGFENVLLLEEPQAAFYSWINEHHDSWQEHVNPGETILVCDIGGGTTDFSLILVSDTDQKLELQRISVGKHLLLGGDNIDLALAHILKQQLEEQGHVIDRWKLLSLVSQSRIGKEKLLLDSSLDSFPISVAGKGSSLFASTVSSKLTQELVEQIVLDGFFPLTGKDQHPSSENFSGIADLGLEFEQDPCFSKHLAKFLFDAFINVQNNNKLNFTPSDNLSAMITPDHILFNGGVFKSEKIKSQVLKILSHWTNKEINQLSSQCLETSVAKGASYFGQNKKDGKGIKIKAGIPRSFYLGVQPSAMAIPGVKPTVKGICIIPQGTKEGSEFKLEHQKFGLHTGKKVDFKFFSSTTRSHDQFGSIVQNAEKELEQSHTLTITLPRDDNSSGLVPVFLKGEISEVGVLNLQMINPENGQTWDLELNVRES